MTTADLDRIELLADRVRELEAIVRELARLPPLWDSDMRRYRYELVDADDCLITRAKRAVEGT